MIYARLFDLACYILLRMPIVTSISPSQVSLRIDRRTTTLLILQLVR